MPAPLPHAVPPGVERVAMLSVHTSPLDQPGTGDGGGLNVYTLEIARRLVRRGVQVDVFTRSASKDDPPSVTVEDGLEVHHIVAGPRKALRKDDLASHLCSFVLGLQRHPSAGSHDLVHSHYWLSGWVGRRVAERWQLPHVQTFHTYGALKNATLAPGDRPESPIRLVAEQRIADSADRVLAMTCGEAGFLHRQLGLSGARISVVPAGVNTDRFRPEGPRPLDIARGRGPLLLFVGRLQPLKGPDIAVATLAEVRKELPDAELLVVGGISGSGLGRTGPAELRRLADGLGVSDAVSFLPAQHQDGLARLYRAADVVLVPSRTETFGLVALEAQACGTPVVAADVSGLQATVQDGGVRVPGHRPADHAAAVVALLQDRARYDRTAAAAAARGQQSSWDRTVDRLLGVYGDVVRAADGLHAAAS